MGSRIIGELQEKSLHHYIKYYLEENPNYHEVSIGPYVADICKDGEIIEIQTQGFDKLRDKLDFYLKDYLVTIVYPIAKTKYLKVNKLNNTSVIRKSPKKGSIYDAVWELYKIKPFLNNKNLRIKLLFLDVLEERNETSMSRKGFFKVEAYPNSVVDLVNINNLSDYLIFVNKMEENFTSNDLAKAKKITKRIASLTLSILKYLGVLEAIGKRGKSYLYQKNAKIAFSPQID